MRWPKWLLTEDRYSADFLPGVIGVVFLCMTLPAIVLLLVRPDRNSGMLGVLLLVLLTGGAVIGLTLLIVGLRVCAFPGSWLYRITRGRLFWR